MFLVVVLSVAMRSRLGCGHVELRGVFIFFQAISSPPSTSLTGYPLCLILEVLSLVTARSSGCVDLSHPLEGVSTTGRTIAVFLPSRFVRLSFVSIFCPAREREAHVWLAVSRLAFRLSSCQ